MQNSYKISAQFVSAGAKFDDEAKDAVKAAISNYNSKSLIAKNPKQIVDYTFSDDDMTLVMILESEADLPMPTKALRLLSSYLVEETNLDKYVSGKQLLKMTTSTIATTIDIPMEAGIDASEDMNRLTRLEKYIKLIKKTDTASLKGLKEIDAMINVLLKEH